MSNIWELYTPTIFDGCMSVIYLGGLHPQNIGRMWFGQIFGFYTPKTFDGCMSVKQLGCLHPRNI